MFRVLIRVSRSISSVFFVLCEDNATSIGGAERSTLTIMILILIMINNTEGRWNTNTKNNGRGRKMTMRRTLVVAVSTLSTFI